MAEEIKKIEEKEEVVEVKKEESSSWYDQTITKDTYTKDEVKALAVKASEYAERNAKKGMVAETEYIKANGELAAYKAKEFDENVSTSFKKLHGDKSRLEDVKKLSNVAVEDTPEQISEKITALKATGKYDFLFKKGNSGGVKETPPKVQKVSKNVFSSQAGAGIFSKLFKKK